MKREETYDNQEEDAKTIFNVISRGADNYDEAQQMLVGYILDENYSRSGISSAITRLEKHFNG